jgi:hypothetical protein
MSTPVKIARQTSTEYERFGGVVVFKLRPYPGRIEVEASFVPKILLRNDSRLYDVCIKQMTISWGAHLSFCPDGIFLADQLPVLLVSREE